MSSNSFPDFCYSQAGSHFESLKNYALPDFILELVAKECDSDFLQRGRREKKLQSLNIKALELLYKTFVKCDTNESGKFAQYRFYAYVASMYYKCEVLINEVISGASGKDHLVPVAVKSNGMYIAVAFNKDVGKPISKKQITKFYKIADDLKLGVHGTQLTDAIYCSSVGFAGKALVELDNLSNKRPHDPETKINFKIANFENQIYSLMR